MATTYWDATLDTDFTQAVALVDSDDVAFDLSATPYTLSCEVRSEAANTLLATAVVTEVTPASGIVNVDLTKELVNTIGIGNRKADIKIVRDSDGYVFRSAPAVLRVAASVTA